MGGAGYAPACCGRLHESVPYSTLAVRCQYVTKDGSPTHHGLDVELPRHASSMWPQVVAGALVPCCWGIDAASGNKPVKLSCEDAESAMSPFGSGRPVRPCLVVNRRWRGCAGLYDRNLATKTISPALRAFLAGQIPFSSGSPRCCDRSAVRPAIPAGRITTRTHWRDLVQPERRNHHG